MHRHCIDVSKNTDKKDLQICQIGAQMYHYTKYVDKHKEEEALNATFFQEINEPKHAQLVQNERNSSDS